MHADRNLLFGILALQMDFITRDALIAAMSAWAIAKDQPLGQILADQGALKPEHRALLEPLVEAHLKAHGGDPRQSLAALSAVDSVRDDLRRIADTDVQASLAHVAPPPTALGSGGTLVQTERPATPRFRILRPHAKGGLGEVFVAEDQELHRQVALKEIQAFHADNPDSRGRFLLEAEVTGGLEHPGIVPVYGLGHYADGRPFYAMRFIKGDSLDEAIHRFHKADGPGRDPRERNLALRDLLGRFVDVCQAVAYAHARGVLHRDLKPANVMLGRYGETLVVDWGLAKLLGRAEADSAEGPLTPSSGSGSTPTEMGAAVGTAAYMSPEQAAGRLDQLGPASDVYSLGATLYHLLTGRPPFEGKDVGAVLRQVQAGDYQPPRQVKPQVPAALEAVCRKALRLRPGERYATPAALAKDVERWLADEPVSAYRERWPARLGRWMRRHRTPVAGVGALLVTTVVFLAVFAAFIEQGRRQSVAEQARTEAARQRTRQALDEMSSQVIETWLSKQQHLELAQKEFLQRMLAYYEEFAAEAGNSKEVRLGVAGAHFRVGDIRAQLGQHQEAEAAYRGALEYYRRLADESPTIPEYRNGLAKTHHNLGVLLAGLGQRPGAETEYRSALKELQRLVDEYPAIHQYHGSLALNHNSLGVLLADLGQPAEAETEFRTGLKEHQRLADEYPAHPEYRHGLAMGHLDLGYLLFGLGKRGEAETECRAAVQEYQRLADAYPSVPEYRDGLAVGRSNLGNLVSALGKKVEAGAEYRAALVEQQRLTEQWPNIPKYRSLLARSHYNLGGLLADLGRAAEAETEFRAALNTTPLDVPNRSGIRNI